MPGSSTRMRSRPWRWTTASATPSSLTRLRSVSVFCWIAKSWRSRIADSVSCTLKPGPSVDLVAFDDQPARELAELQQLIAGVERADDLFGAIHVGRLDDRDLQHRADDADVVADVALAELRANVGLVSRQVLPDGLDRGRPGRENARRRADRGRAASARAPSLEPTRRARRQRQRDDVVRHRLRQDIAGRSLLLRPRSSRTSADVPSIVGAT